MNKEPLILSLDCGTQSVRALLFDLQGTLLAKVKREYEPYISPRPGWAEQDPEVFWDNAVLACGQLKEEEPLLFSRIAGVGVTTQRDSMINVDSRGNPLRNATIWLDQRTAVPPYTPRGAKGLVYNAVGMKEALLKTQMAGKSNWIRQKQPEIWKSTWKYVQVSGFLNGRLTGNYADSQASQIGHLPFNYKKMRWSRPGELNGKLFPVEEEKLAELYPPGAVLGKIQASAAEVTGLPQGIPVIACGSDKGCETIGMGVIDTSMASLSFGTTATVQTTSERYFEPLRFMPAYPAPVPGHYNPEVEIFRGYWMISWFKQEFAQSEVMEAGKRGVAPEKVLDHYLKEIPAGSMGLMLQPYWGPGLKNPSAKGAVIGFGDVHKRGHLYKAVIEGLGYALRDGLEKMEKAGRCRVGRLAVSGGASQSDQICQISADIFRKPLVRGKTCETAGLGAALITAVGLGYYADYREAIRGMVGYADTFYPHHERGELYDQLYRRVYQKIYPALENLYEEIRDITGYPEKIK